MFFCKSNAIEIPIGRTVRVNGTHGILTKIDGTLINVTFHGMAYSEFVWVDNSRWYSTKEKYPRARLTDLDHHFIDNGNLFYYDMDALIPKRNVGIHVNGKLTSVRILAETCLDMCWDESSTNVSEIHLGETLSWPCLVMIDTNGQAYYAVYCTDGDYEEVQLYTTVNGIFTRLDDELTGWSFED